MLKKDTLISTPLLRRKLAEWKMLRIPTNEAFTLAMCDFYADLL
jgi:hypothetical protein